MAPESARAGNSGQKLAVSVIVIRRNGTHAEVSLPRRTRPLAGEWCQVAGAIETGETARQAALRETTEEAGPTLERLYSAHICGQFYEADRDAISLLPVFVGHACSQDAVHLNPEPSGFRQVGLDAAVEMVPFAGQRHVLRHVQKESVEREPNRWLLIRLP